MTSITLLAELKISDIKHYMLEHGWKIEKPQTYRSIAKFDNNFDFVFGDSDSPLENQRILKYLSGFYDTEETALIKKIYSKKYDLLKIVKGNTSSFGKMSFPDFLKITEKIADILSFAMCSELSDSPKPYYPKRLQKVLEHLKNISISQTEAGSFITNIKVPHGVPRKALSRIFIGINEIEYSNDPGKLAESGYETGMNANVASSLAEICRDNEDIELHVKWDECEELPTGISSRDTYVRLKCAMSERLEQYARAATSISPISKQSYIGLIRKISKGESSFDSTGIFIASKTNVVMTVTNIDLDSEAPKQINSLHVEFMPEKYNEVFDCAKNNIPIQISGDLYKEGKSWVLRNIVKFTSFSQEKVIK